MKSLFIVAVSGAIVSFVSSVGILGNAVNGKCPGYSGIASYSLSALVFLGFIAGVLLLATLLLSDVPKELVIPISTLLRTQEECV